MSSSCQTSCKNMKLTEPPTPDSQTITDSIANIMKSMGVTSCSTTSSGSTKWDAYKTDLGWFGTYGGSNAAVKTEGTSLGCEQITAIAQQYYVAKSHIAQILNCSCREISTSISSINSIRFESDDLTMTCGAGGLNLSQINKLKMVDTSTVSSESKLDIGQVLNTFANATATTLQEAITDVGAAQKGQRVVENIQQKISDNAYIGEFTQTIDNILRSITGRNEIVFRGKHMVISGDSCNISQESVIDLTAQTILNDSISNLMKTDDFTELTSAVSSSQKSKDEGLSTATEKVGEAITSFNNSIGSSGTIMSAVIIAVVVIGITIVVLKMKGGSGSTVINLGGAGGQPSLRSNLKVIGITFIITLILVVGILLVVFWPQIHVFKVK